MRKQVYILLSILMILGTGILHADAPQSAAATLMESAAVQHGGRVKPFLSFAWESVLAITGETSYEKMRPAELILGWMADPETWMARPFIRVTFRPLEKYFPVLIKHRVSAEVILGHKSFSDMAELAIKKQATKQPLSLEEKEAIALYEKAYRFRQIAEGAAPGWLPIPGDPRQAWISLEDLKQLAQHSGMAGFYSAEETIAVEAAWKGFASAYQKNPASEEAASQAMLFENTLNNLAEAHGIFLAGGALNEELVYVRLHPFGWAWRLYGASFLLFLFLMVMPVGVIKKIPEVSRTWMAASLLAAGFFFHSYGFYLRCIIAGRPPVSNMYESIIWVSWAVTFISIILYSTSRSVILPMAATAVSTGALVLAELFPALLDPTVSPLVPVLRSNFWLSTHVLTITFSYGAFALAWMLGHVVVFRYAIWKEQRKANEAVAQFLYRALQIGVILLASGTVLGGVWANYSWGRFWGWDPKETWALIALLAYAAILHAKRAGWVDIFGTAAWSVAGFAGVVMAWYGVNFVLAAGLHSYGFGGGGAPYVVGFFLGDFLIVGTLALWHHTSRKHT